MATTNIILAIRITIGEASFAGQNLPNEKVAQSHALVSKTNMINKHSLIIELIS